MKKILALAFILFGLSFFLAKPGNALIISHPILEIDANPGETITKTVRLENETDQSITFYSEKTLFKAENESGKAQLVPAQTADEIGLLNWITVQPGPITLEPKKYKETEIKITIPQNGEPGGHYAAVLWTSRDPKIELKKTDENVSLGWRTGHLILLKVAGPINENGQLVSFKTTNNTSLYNYLPVNFDTEFKNDGTIHLKPVGQIEIKNMLGQKEKVITFNPENGNVLPKSSRKFENSWTKTENKIYGQNFTEKVRQEWENFGLGKYQASLMIFYGENQTQANQTIDFWVFPWRIILLAVITLIIIITILIVGIKQYNKAIIKKALAKK